MSIEGNSQRVKIEGTCSEFKCIKAGVPQRPLLGSLLFNIYINDVNYSVPNMALRLYADDTTGYNSDHGFVFSSTVHGQYNLSALSTWFEQNLLVVNKAKTQAIEL